MGEQLQAVGALDVDIELARAVAERELPAVEAQDAIDVDLCGDHGHQLARVDTVVVGHGAGQPAEREPLKRPTQDARGGDADALGVLDAAHP